MRKLMYALLTVFVMMQVVMGVKMEVYAKTYVQSVGSNTKVTYTYQMEKGSSTNVAVTKVTIANPTSGMTLGFPEEIKETVNGQSKTYKITRICQGSVDQLDVAAIKLPMSLKFLDEKSLFGTTGNLKTVYIPETIEVINPTTFDIAGGVYTPIRNIYIRVSSTSNVKLDSVSNVKKIIDRIYFTKGSDNDVFQSCDKSGKPVKNGILQLFDVMRKNPIFVDITDKYATEIVKNIIPSGASEAQRMQIIYNYIVTTCRYSKIQSGSSFLGSLNQGAFGTLFLHSGVCAGRASALNLLAKKAGLDVVYCNNQWHAWSIFKPTGGKGYYFVDTCNSTCLTGSGSHKYDFSAEDAKKYTMAKDYYGDCIELEIDNKSGVSFTLSMVDIDHKDRKYFEYLATDCNDTTVYKASDFMKNKYQQVYANSHAYYQMTIKQGSKTLVSFNTINHNVTFKDNNGKTHTCKIYEKKDGRNNTKYGSAYIFTIE